MWVRMFTLYAGGSDFFSLYATQNLVSLQRRYEWTNPSNFMEVHTYSGHS